MNDNRPELLEALRKAFPDACQDALENEVDFFSTPFSIEPMMLNAADRTAEAKLLDQVTTGLNSALAAYNGLHPKVRCEFDQQFKLSLAEGQSLAPGLARPILDARGLFGALAALIWVTSGRYPENPDLPPTAPKVSAAISPARSAIKDLVQITGQSGGGRRTLERVGLVDRVWSVWRKYTGAEPEQPMGKRFLALVQAYIHAHGEYLPPDLDAKSAVNTYLSQRGGPLSQAVRNPPSCG